MRILCVGDQHFRLQLPYYSALADGRKDEWKETIQAIHKAAEGVDAVVLLGDNLNSRHNHSSVIRDFVDFLKGFGDKQLYVIAGNHERYGKSTALDFLENMKIPRWHIYSGVPERAIHFDDKHTFVFLPYVTPAMLESGSNEEASAKLLASLPKATALFLHHAISGSEWDSGDAEHMNEIVLPREGLEEKFDWIVGGHIHEPQKLSPKTLVAGSIFTSTVGEKSKSIWILDTEKGYEEIKLPVRGIQKMYINPGETIVPDAIPKNSIVKCIVTDRAIGIDFVKDLLSRFDAAIIVEQYPSQREKMSVEDAQALDLSLGNLLRVYSEARDVSYADLKEALDILDEHEISRT